MLRAGNAITMRVLYPTIILTALTIAASKTSAQNKPTMSTLLPPPQNVIIDGKLNEWGDSLRYLNEEKKINYTLANNNENLYIAVRLNDRMDQLRVLNAGLTVGIDPKGKKKDSYSITFQLSDQPGSPLMMHLNNADVS